MSEEVTYETYVKCVTECIDMVRIVGCFVVYSVIIKYGLFDLPPLSFGRRAHSGG